MSKTPNGVFEREITGKPSCLDWMIQTLKLGNFGMKRVLCYSSMMNHDDQEEAKIEVRKDKEEGDFSVK